VSSGQAEVWAPNATHRVELCLRNRRIPLEPAAGGWWRSREPELDHGTDYAFSIDGHDPRPDPRSRWQPDGPHGWSRWIDHEKFAWPDDGYQPPAWESAVVYELHVGTFTPLGTFDGAVGRLDDLVALGISHVELMPVAEFPGARGWGYDGVDLFAPKSSYGGPDGMKRFVAAAHDRGLAVLLDVVYNHFGPDGNYLAEFGPYLSERHRTLWGAAVNLDGPGSDEVRRFFIDNAVQWLRDYRCDGLRLDAIHAFIDTSAVHFLEQLSMEVDALEQTLDRRLMVIAESDLGDPRIVRPREQHGIGLDAQWNDEFRHALHAVLTEERDGIHGDFRGIEDLGTAIRDVFVYQGQRSEYRNRRHGRPVDRDLPRWKFVSFFQNHDQTGNRAQGERSSQLLAPDALMVAAGLVLLGPNVPMLFAGEEWAAGTPFLYFTDHPDADLGAAVREGRRQEFAAFGWPEDEIPDPQAADTFERSRLDWDERTRAPNARMLEWHRRLIGLRRGLPQLAADAWPEVAVDADAGWITVRRNGTLLLANLGAGVATLALPHDTERWRIEVASSELVALGRDDDATIDVPPVSVVLLLEGPSQVGT
jgi:maltooligosyltrehalose trehalohydrolase